MSNQVYGNNQQKYYGQRGLAIQRVGTNVTINDTLAHILDFNSQTVTYPVGKWYFSRDAPSSSIVFDEEGVYSIDVVIGIYRNPALAPVDTPVNIDFILERAEPVTVDIMPETLNGSYLGHTNLFVVGFNDETEGYYYTSMSHTGYFAKGAGFLVKYQSLFTESEGKVSILGGSAVNSSKLIITKLI